MLKKTGFSGVDTFTPMLDPRPFTASVFVAQAVDDNVNLLRRPLASRPKDIHFEHLVLLGGDSMITSTLVEELEDLLRPRSQDLVVATSLDELDTLSLPPLTAVLSLADIDSPVFKGITEERYNNLKQLLGAAGSLLWVTHGSWCEEPDAGTMAGLLRSLPYEHAYQRSQLLEVVDTKDLNAKLLAELLLRIQLGQQWKATSEANNMLWTLEPELVLESGNLKILRQMPDEEANDRYNSAKRIITEDIDLNSSDADLKFYDSGYALRKSKIVASDASIHVNYSTLASIRTPAGLLFLSIGTQNGKKVLALSDNNASSIQTSSSVAVDLSALTEEEFLTAAGAYLLGQQMLATASPGSVILIHEPSPVLAAVLASEQSVKVAFSTSHAPLPGPGWVRIHPRTPSRDILKLLPSRIDSFFNLSNSTDRSDLGRRISELLPKTCLQQKVSSLFSHESVAYANINFTTDLLRNASAFIAASPIVGDAIKSGPVTSLNLIDISSKVNEPNPLALINWRVNTVIPVGLEPIDSQTNLFKGDKTYWLVGLAGDLGQSLVDWMASHGARYIVLSSRSATSQVPAEWVEAHASSGVTIKLIAR